MAINAKKDTVTINEFRMKSGAWNPTNYPLRMENSPTKHDLVPSFATSSGWTTYCVLQKMLDHTYFGNNVLRLNNSYSSACYKPYHRHPKNKTNMIWYGIPF